MEYAYCGSKKYMAKCLASVRCRNTKIWGFVVEY